mmetsp:Transcript_3997/g.12571  ORF Transcript_3997/g.12571 Transcript_3997/m.12571 type:complete len:311 (+) Transcript_3997:183-1115(+)
MRVWWCRAGHQKMVQRFRRVVRAATRTTRVMHASSMRPLLSLPRKLQRSSLLRWNLTAQGTLSKRWPVTARQCSGSLLLPLLALRAILTGWCCQDMLARFWAALFTSRAWLEHPLQPQWSSILAVHSWALVQMAPLCPSQLAGASVRPLPLLWAEPPVYWCSTRLLLPSRSLRARPTPRPGRTVPARPPARWATSGSRRPAARRLWPRRTGCPRGRSAPGAGSLPWRSATAWWAEHRPRPPAPGCACRSWRGSTGWLESSARASCRPRRAQPRPQRQPPRGLRGFSLQGGERWACGFSTAHRHHVGGCPL